MTTRISHRELGEIRRQAADDIRAGQSLQEVAKHYGRSWGWAQGVCYEFGLTIGTTPAMQNRQERQKAIADAVAGGESVEDVAIRFGCSRTTARFACVKHGVVFSRKPYLKLAVPTIVIIADLLAGAGNQSEIARRRGSKKQWVSQIAQILRSYGHVLPKVQKKKIGG